MAEFVIAGSEAMRKITEALGLPKYTQEFTVEGSVDGLLQITVTYTPTVDELFKGTDK